MATESSLRFLADQQMSLGLVRILGKLGEKCLLHISMVPDLDGTADDYWIPTAASRNFICITCDRNTLNDAVISQAMRSSQARMIFLCHKYAQSDKWDQLCWFLRYWRKVKEYAKTMAPGDMIRVHWNGRIIPVDPSKPMHRSTRR